jgi:hypothetical protein
VNFPSPAAPGNRAVFLLSLALAAVLAIGARTPSFWVFATDVTPRVPPTMAQHATGGSDGSATLEPSDPAGTAPTVVAWPIALKPRHVYAISFTATNVGRQAIDVATDFQGTNYDAPEQEFASSLPLDHTPRTFRALLDSGDPPPDVRLRFFYKDVASVEVRNVAVLERPGYWKWLGRLGWLLGAIAVGWLATFVASTRLAPRLVALNAQPSGMFRLSLAAGLVAASALLIFMSWLGQPQIFSDEFVYAYLTTHFGHEAAIATSGWVILDLPNRLFLGLYHVLLGSAADPYMAARAINIVFVLVAFAALLDCVRRARGGIWCWIVTLAGVLGPATTYAAYFMPETAFIALLYWLIVVAADATSARRVGSAALAGTLAACLILVKPHGIVPTLVIGAVMAVAALRTSRLERRRAWLVVGAYAFATYAVRALLVRLLAPEGTIDTTLTGAYYADVPGQALALVRDPMRFVGLLNMLGAHALVTMLLAAPAILAAIQLVPRFLQSDAQDEADPHVRFAIVVLVMAVTVCIALMAMTAIFTVTITGEGVFEVPNRLHLRYYAFCLPLVVVAFACVVHHQPQRASTQLLHYGLWLAVAATAITVLPDYVWHIADAPDLFLGEQVRHWITPLLVLAVGATFVVVNRIWFGIELSSLFVLGFLAVGTVTATAVRVAQLQDRPQDADRAGRVAATMARGSQVPLLIVGNGYPPDVFRIGAYALERAQFAQQTPAAIGQRLATLPPRTVIAGPGESLSLAGLPTMIQFGPYGVAQAPVAAPRPATATPPIAHPEPAIRP